MGGDSVMHLSSISATGHTSQNSIGTVILHSIKKAQT